MPRYNGNQERETKRKQKPDIEKAMANQKKIEEKGYFKIIPNSIGNKAIFVPYGK